MNIAVIDVAAESSGALSVLNDFSKSLNLIENGSNNEWFIFTSIINIPETVNIHNIKFPNIKKSWGHRLYWEYFVLPKLIKKYNIDTVFSLQNNAMPIIKNRQIIYFHNVLLSQKEVKFSLLKKEERPYAIYTKILAPYIRRTWKKANGIIVQGDAVKKQVSRYFNQEAIKVCKPQISLKDLPKAHEIIKGYIYPATAQTYKNFEVIISAAKELENRGCHTEFLFTITGDENAYANKIKQLSRDIPSIKLIGFLSREELLNKFQEYGLVMTSNIESCSVPIIEAMGVGTVIVGVNKDYVLEHYEKTQYNRMLFFRDINDLPDVLLEGLSNELKSNYKQEKSGEGMEQVIQLLKMK